MCQKYFWQAFGKAFVFWYLSQTWKKKCVEWLSLHVWYREHDGEAQDLQLWELGTDLAVTNLCIEKREGLLGNSGQKREKCPQSVEVKACVVCPVNQRKCKRVWKAVWASGCVVLGISRRTSVEQLTKQVLGITHFQTLEKQLGVTTWTVSINGIFWKTKRSSGQRGKEHTQ